MPTALTVRTSAPSAFLMELFIFFCFGLDQKVILWYGCSSCGGFELIVQGEALDGDWWKEERKERNKLGGKFSMYLGFSTKSFSDFSRLDFGIEPWSCSTHCSI